MWFIDELKESQSWLYDYDSEITVVQINLLYDPNDETKGE